MTIKVTFHDTNAPDGKRKPFVRYFPDMETWVGVKAHLTWAYTAIKVEDQPEMRYCQYCKQYHCFSTSSTV